MMSAPDNTGPSIKAFLQGTQQAVFHCNRGYAGQQTAIKNISCCDSDTQMNMTHLSIICLMSKTPAINLAANLYRLKDRKIVVYGKSA